MTIKAFFPLPSVAQPRVGARAVFPQVGSAF